MLLSKYIFATNNFENRNLPKIKFNILPRDSPKYTQTKFLENGKILPSYLEFSKLPANDFDDKIPLLFL